MLSKRKYQSKTKSKYNILKSIMGKNFNKRCLNTHMLRLISLNTSNRIINKNLIHMRSKSKNHWLNRISFTDYP